MRVVAGVVQRAEVLWDGVDVVDDDAVVAGLQLLDLSVGGVEERGSVEENLLRLLHDEDGEGLALELQEGNDVVEEDVEVLQAVPVRHDDGQSLTGRAVARRPTASRHGAVLFQQESGVVVHLRDVNSVRNQVFSVQA